MIIPEEDVPKNQVTFKKINTHIKPLLHLKLKQNQPSVERHKEKTGKGMNVLK